VAAHQGIELSRTPRIVAASEAAHQSVARANRIGLRRVQLRGAWWRSDNGPLLGWRGEASHPVALLPQGRRRSYRLWDPADRSSVVIDEGVAAEIEVSAVMACRPIPPDVEGVLGLVRFACRGFGRELATILAVAALASAVAALFPVATGFLFESAVPRAETGQVVAVILGLVFASLGAGVFDLTKAIALLRLEGRLEAAMQPALMHRMLGLPVNFFRGFGTGELTNRVLSIQTMRRLLAGNTFLSMLSALFAASSFVIILLFSPLLAVVSAGLSVVAAVVSAGLAVGELRQERARVRLGGQEDSLVIQIIQGIAKLRVASAEGFRRV